MPKPRGYAAWQMVVALIVLAFCVLAVVALLRLDTWAERGSGLSPAFEFNVADQLRIDPALIKYAQVDEIGLAMDKVCAVAVGPDDHIYVAGDQTVHVMQPDGSQVRRYSLEGVPSCLAVGGADHAGPGRTYIGVSGKIAVHDREGQPVTVWEEFGEDAVLTSIGVTPSDIFVADAGNRIVLRLNLDGEVLGRIGEQQSEDSLGFVIPSPYFDVAVDQEEMVHVVNPAARRIETYDYDGGLQTIWGEASSDIRGFFGCCNPSHFARLSDGRFVTSEKGIARVKLYDQQGDFVCVVAGPQQLDLDPSSLGDPRYTESLSAYDVAVDSQGRILVLDTVQKAVRVFVPDEQKTKDAA